MYPPFQLCLRRFVSSFSIVSTNGSDFDAMVSKQLLGVELNNDGFYDVLQKYDPEVSQTLNEYDAILQVIMQEFRHEPQYLSLNPRTL
ncbi:hypothetical protein D3C87_1670160 [compost metagenome]